MFNPTLTDSDLERFFSHFTMSGLNECWDWNGHYTDPIVSIPMFHLQSTGKNHNVSRIGWVIARGPIPDGMSVVHTCGNDMCVNPNHMVLNRGPKVAQPKSYAMFTLTKSEQDIAVSKLIAHCAIRENGCVEYVAGRCDSHPPKPNTQPRIPIRYDMRVNAKKAAYFLMYGPFPTLHLINTCGNIKCINPEHHKVEVN